MASSPPRRFLPPDPRAEAPYRLTPQLAFRVALLGALALAVFAILFLRLWALQVLSGDSYAAAANDNRVRTLRIDAARGAILDRDGAPLVVNTLGTRVEIWPADLPKNWPAQRAELRKLSRIVGVPVREILARMRKHEKDPLTPVVVQYGIHADQYSYISERQDEFPGVQLTDSYLRKYPHHALAAHVLGHVGEITEPELKQRRKLGYRLGDIVGQSGVEDVYDRYLRGRDGSAQLTVDSRGRPKSAVQVRTNPRKGNNLKLTLDIGLQRAAEQAIKYGIDLAHADHHWEAKAGAVAALDPRDGAVLALASYPTYQPAWYVGRGDKEKLKRLLNPAEAEKYNYPGLDRALEGVYPSGSTFKPLTAIAALQEHLLLPHESILCSPDFKVGSIPGKEQIFKNWTPNIDQWIELSTALAMSCDTYFYRVGMRFYDLPPNRGHPFQSWASRLGFGHPTGIDIGPESSGLVPTPEWRQNAFAGPKYSELDRTWKPGYSVQLAIGQGDLLVTPIQMARFYALVANGGKLVTPHIAEDVEQPTSDPRAPRVLRRFASQPPRPSGVDPTALQDIRDGLYAATHSTIGTSSGVFGAFPVPIAGKTGTAEKVVNLPGYPAGHTEDQSWWCGYGPTYAPTIVVCALIEHGGHGGTAAAPAALKVFEQYFHQQGAIQQVPSD
ncbi:MAG TPA: penicillin-binding protein 2 [Gaiellaceae bacterium]